MSGFIYLASPYSHPLVTVRMERFEAACRAAAKLMRDGQAVFSPIAHSHPIEQHFGGIECLDFWMRQDIAMLRHAARMVVLCLDGWQQSKGIAREMQIARELGIPVEFMSAA